MTTNDEPPIITSLPSFQTDLHKLLHATLAQRNDLQLTNSKPESQQLLEKALLINSQSQELSGGQGRQAETSPQPPKSLDSAIVCSECCYLLGQGRQAETPQPQKSLDGAIVMCSKTRSPYLCRFHR